MDATAPSRADVATVADPLWRPALIVFIGNTCIMTVELVASRIVAPIVGVSLYTWTTIIGVMLAGISLGNFVGGKLADRYGSRRFLGGTLILAGLSILSILILVEEYGLKGLQPMEGWPLIARMIVFVAVMFGWPSVMLGLVSPMVMKLTVSDLKRSGSDVGRIYAAGTFGSIVGTFLTGFYLVSAFGSRNVVIAAAAVLIGLGVLVGQWVRAWPVLAVGGVVAAGLVFVAPLDKYMKDYCTIESNYFCIRVREQELSGTVFQVLTLDHLVHSYNALDDPAKLQYPYEQVGAEVAEFLIKRDGALNMLLIGGGGYTLPRFLEFAWPPDKAQMDVVEIDPEVTRVAYERMGMKADSRVRNFNEDARQYLTFREPTTKYNLIQGDAFNDFSVPYHLTTREFNELVKRHLTDDGIYLVNMIDGGDTLFSKALIRTLKQTFPHVYFVPTNRAYDGIRLNTMLAIASAKPLDENALREAAGNDARRHIDEWLIEGHKLDEWLAKGAQTTLTDDYVPTDNLLAPVFEIKLGAR